MAINSRGRAPELQMPRNWKDRDTSPERTKVWTEPKPKSERKVPVPVVYYLSRNGQLEHPHFLEVPLSSSKGLYLRDVISRLNFLRGNGVASMYSWSSKRSYKNGFVWHDLSENDLIYPAHGQEYVLKGSELLESSSSVGTQDIVSSSSEKQPEKHKSGEDCGFPVVIRRRNQSWSSIDLHEYKVYKAEATGQFSEKAADASTQTDDKRRRRRAIREEEEEEQEQTPPAEEQYQNHTTELSREEISPPPSNSSPETLESLIKADGRLISCSRIVDESDIRDQTTNNHPSGRIKASTVLMQLISCGSFSSKDSATSAKDQGFSLISHYRTKLPYIASNQESKEVDCLMENPSFAGIQIEDKEYFSGSLVETKKDEIPTLKRSSSCNADRSSKLEIAEEEVGAQGRCIPRKLKTSSMKKDNNQISRSSQHGSKRISYEPAVN